MFLTSLTRKQSSYIAMQLDTNEKFNLQSSREHPDCKHDAGP